MRFAKLGDAVDSDDDDDDDDEDEDDDVVVGIAFIVGAAIDVAGAATELRVTLPLLPAFDLRSSSSVGASYSPINF